MKRQGLCIFINTVLEGTIPFVRGNSSDDNGSARDGIWIFDTELEAQREIADGMMTRLEEYVAEVGVLPDSRIVDAKVNCFG